MFRSYSNYDVYKILHILTGLIKHGKSLLLDKGWQRTRYKANIKL